MTALLYFILKGEPLIDNIGFAILCVVDIMLLFVFADYIKKMKE